MDQTGRQKDKVDPESHCAFLFASIANGTVGVRCRPGAAGCTGDGSGRSNFWIVVTDHRGFEC
jgi:hypothetical protein